MGLVCTRGVLYKTTNGGTSWTNILIRDVDVALTGVHFSSSMHGVSACIHQEPLIIIIIIIISISISIIIIIIIIIYYYLLLLNMLILAQLNSFTHLRAQLVLRGRGFRKP
jgi:hypothetical protein